MWSMGLIETLKNTKNHIITSECAVVIKDKFPKAKYHYLVCPKENIPSIFHLQQDHLKLLNDLNLLASNIIEINRLHRDFFQVGFHAEPSMQLLHLHVISKDFTSEYMRTKKHWNSFNTTLFLPFEQVIDTIKSKGIIERMTKDEIKRLASTDLYCNQCKFFAKNMPVLKEHLLIHMQKTVLLNA